MDEYLFITMAKLKADRLKLEREQRAVLREQLPREEAPVSSGRHSERVRWFSREPQWRAQS